MKKLFLITIFSLTLCACDRHDHKHKHEHNADNTERNIRDRDSTTQTPLDQSENEADRVITQKIRQIIVADDALSTNAKNIKIITVGRVVTLRGPVLNQQEKDAIAKKIHEVQGIEKVDNQLEVTQK